MQLTVSFTLDGHALREFEALPLELREQVERLFERLRVEGTIRNGQKFKKLCLGLWEFKVFQLRMIGAFHGHSFLIAHVVIKKSDEHKRRDLYTARRRIDEHIQIASYSTLHDLVGKPAKPPPSQGGE